MRKTDFKLSENTTPKVINFELDVPEPDFEKVKLSGSRAIDSGNFRLTYRDSCWMLHQYLINIGAQNVIKAVSSELSRTISVASEKMNSEGNTVASSTVPVYFASNDDLRHFVAVTNSLNDLQTYSEDRMSTIGAFLKVCLLFSDHLGGAKFRSSALNSLVVWREHALGKNDFNISIRGDLATIKINKLVGIKDWDVNGYAYGWYSTHIAALRQALLRSRAWADPNTHDDISNPAKTKLLESRALFLSLVDPTFGVGLSWHQSFCNYNSLLAARKCWTQRDPDSRTLLYRWEEFPTMASVWHNAYLSGNWGLSNESLLSQKILSQNVVSCPWLKLLSDCEDVKFDFTQAREALNLACSENGVPVSVATRILDLLCRISEPASLQFEELPYYAPLIWNGFVEQQSRMNLFFGVDTKTYVKLLDVPRGHADSTRNQMLKPSSRVKFDRDRLQLIDSQMKPDRVDGRLCRWGEGLLDDFTKRDLRYI